MIANQMRKAYQNRKTQFILVACEEPFWHSSSNNKVLTSEEKLHKPEKGEQVYPASGGHGTVFDIADL